MESGEDERLTGKPEAICVLSLSVSIEGAVPLDHTVLHPKDPPISLQPRWLLPPTPGAVSETKSTSSWTLGPES